MGIFPWEKAEVVHEDKQSESTQEEQEPDPPQKESYEESSNG